MAAFLATNPIPKRDPTDTCVVETGRPYLVARITSKPVERFAASP
jgi:hypothetical protein